MAKVLCSGSSFRCFHLITVRKEPSQKRKKGRHHMTMRVRLNRTFWSGTTLALMLLLGAGAWTQEPKSQPKETPAEWKQVEAQWGAPVSYRQTAHSGIESLEDS